MNVNFYRCFTDSVTIRTVAFFVSFSYTYFGGCMGNTAEMPENEIKSELSRAYIHAVASRAGCACQWADRQTDNLGIDATIRFRGNFERLQNTNRLVTFDIQVKSTSQGIRYDGQGRIIYDGLTKVRYDDYRDANRTIPLFLILFDLPENSVEWLTLVVSGIY
jgi:hypothetical protein